MLDKVYPMYQDDCPVAEELWAVNCPMSGVNANSWARVALP